MRRPVFFFSNMWSENGGSWIETVRRIIRLSPLQTFPFASFLICIFSSHISEMNSGGYLSPPIWYVTERGIYGIQSVPRLCRERISNASLGAHVAAWNWSDSIRKGQNTDTFNIFMTTAATMTPAPIDTTRFRLNSSHDVKSRKILLEVFPFILSLAVFSLLFFFFYVWTIKGITWECHCQIWFILFHFFLGEARRSSFPNESKFNSIRLVIEYSADFFPASVCSASEIRMLESRF